MAKVRHIKQYATIFDVTCNHMLLYSFLSDDSVLVCLLKTNFKECGDQLLGHTHKHNIKPTFEVKYFTKINVNVEASYSIEEEGMMLSTT